jgi:ketosteroid isomerase-like protein
VNILKSNLVVAMGLVALAGCQPAAQDTAADEAVIRLSAPAWAAAYNAGDADTLTAMYWEDAVLQPPGAPAATGHAAIRGFLAGDSAATKAAGLTMNIPEAGAVDVSGDLAYEAGTYSVTDASGATVDTGKYIGVFLKKDGKWLYIRDTWNSDTAPAPAPAAEPAVEPAAP